MCHNRPVSLSCWRTIVSASAAPSLAAMRARPSADDATLPSRKHAASITRVLPTLSRTCVTDVSLMPVAYVALMPVTYVSRVWNGCVAYAFHHARVAHVVPHLCNGYVTVTSMQRVCHVHAVQPQELLRRV